MEEHNDNSSQSNVNSEQSDSQSHTPSGQVMDVTAPQTVNDTPQATSSDASSSPDENNMSSTNDQQPSVDSSSNEPESISSTQEPEVTPDTTTPVSTAEQSVEQNQQPKPNELNKKPHHKMPIIAVIIAIIVAVLLAGLVVFAYTKNKNGDIKRKDTSTKATSEVKTQANASDVDQTGKDIDTALKQTDDVADFPPAEFSDASLGL